MSGRDSALSRETVRQRAKEEIGGDVRGSCTTCPSRRRRSTAYVEELGALGLDERARVMMEKPFGYDLASARELNASVHEVFDESQVFRIDHYLGKEAVQNILALRFANGMFEPIWNRDHIDHVQIDVPETLSIGTRAGFYEGTGAFRDMVVTHLFQVLGFVAMEPPASLDPKPYWSPRRRRCSTRCRRCVPRTSCAASTTGYRRGGGRRARLRHGDVRRRAGLRRQLALGGRPVLPATGKRLAESHHLLTLAFRAAAAADVPDRLPLRSGVVRKRPPHVRARRSRQHLGELPRQGSGPDHAARRGPHGLQLRRRLRRPRARRSRPTSASSTT